MKINKYLVSLSIIVGVVFLTGCATKSYVQEKIAPIDTRVSKLETKAASIESKTSDLEKSIASNRDKIDSVEKRLHGIAGDAMSAKLTAQTALKKVEGLRIAKKVILKNSDVRFNFNKWQLTKSAKEILDNLALELAGKSYSFIVIAGHTDSVGPEGYNFYLGRIRAEAAASYLATKDGIDRGKIIITTFGESAPVASNKTKEGREQNRRVEITIYDEALE